MLICMSSLRRMHEAPCPTVGLQWQLGMGLSTFSAEMISMAAVLAEKRRFLGQRNA